jgi:hypothetical protein
MSSKTLEILDNALRYSLWAFLVLFLLGVAYLFFVRRKEAGVYLIRSFFRVAMFAGLVAAVLFLVVAFTPLSFFDNFATATSLEEPTPLRLTAIVYERFFEGFSLDGEVWNQTGKAMDGIQVQVIVWGKDKKQLDRLLLPVEPSPLPARSPGKFSLRYEENSPFLEGYEVHFVTATGNPIPHVKGFDIKKPQAF